MTDGEAKALMAHHGITSAPRAVYQYRGYVYGNLMDAVNYAELITGREDELTASRARDERAHRG